MAEAMRDRFANLAMLRVTQSAANTITFATLELNIGLLPTRQGAVAMVIDQLDYFYRNQELMTADTDIQLMGVTISDSVTDLSDPTDRRILHTTELQRFDLGGAAGNPQVIERPRTFQFFPPIIHAEKRLYLGLDSTGLASAATGDVRIYYRLVQLTPAELVELTEVFRLVG